MVVGTALRIAKKGEDVVVAVLWAEAPYRQSQSWNDPLAGQGFV